MRRLAVQIAVSALPLVCLTAAIGVYATSLLTDLGGAVGRVLAENYRSVLAAERMQGALRLQAIARRDADLAGFRAAGDDFETALAEAFGSAALPNETVLLDSIAAGYDAYSSATERGMPPGLDLQADLLDAQARRLLAMNQTAILDKNANAEMEAERARRALAWAVALAIALSVALSIQFARRISRPIQLLTAGVDDIARGRFESRVSTADGGEVGALATAFNSMARRLQAFEAINVQALLREKKTAESLIEAIPSPVVVTDEEGALQLHNHAAEAFLAAPRPAGDVPLVDAAPAIAQALASTPPRPDGGRLADVASADGTRTYQLRQRMVHVPAPTPDAEDARLTITLLDDVTPLQTLDRTRREFLAAVSHELRTPLTSLSIAVDLLRRSYAGPISNEQADLLTTARADTDRMKALVSRLLDLARLDVAGLRLGPVSAGAVLEAAAAGVALDAEARGVTLHVDVPPDLPTLTGDAEALGWAVSNLAVNAVRHAASTVALAVRADDARIRIEVRDDGPGVPAGAEHEIFEPLVQLAAAGGTRPGSAGLGLTIVRRVAVAHGGEAHAVLGAGGHFAITLPLAPPP